MDDFISHYGVKRRSGRYPWGSGRNPYQGESKKFIRKTPAEQLKDIKSMNADMNSWKYAVIIDGKVIKDPKDADWSKYRTVPVKDVEKYHAGVCWDFVNYQHSVFKQKGYDDESHMFVMQIGDDPNNIVTHTFSTVNIGEKKYWFESSWLKHQGIHEVNSFEDVTKVLRKEYGEGNQYDVYKYNPDGLDKNLTNGEFFKKATQNLVYTNTKNVKHEEVKEMTADDFIAHFGIKRRSGRYPWGSGERPYQGDDIKVKQKSVESRRREESKKSSIRRMSDDEIDNKIRRLDKEKRLKQLSDEDINQAKKEVANALKNIGKTTLTTLASGAISYGIYSALSKKPLTPENLAKFVYGNRTKDDNK